MNHLPRTPLDATIWHMGQKLILLAAVWCALSSVAQVSPDEAAARLKAKEASRAAASQPSDDNLRTIRILQEQLAQLKGENASLKREVDSLRKELAKVPTARPVAGKNAIEVGMTRDEADAAAQLGKMVYDSQTFETLEGGKKVTREVWEFRNWNPGYGSRVTIVNGVVTQVRREH